MISGSLRAYCVSEEGREVTLYRVGSGGLCVLSASCLLDSIAFEVFVETAFPTRLCILPVSAIRRVEEKNVRLSLFLYKSATEKFSEVLFALQRLLFMKIDRRIAIFLREEMRRQGKTELKITHSKIAEEIGSAREVVTKTLGYIESEGALILERGKIRILNIAALQKICGD